MIFWTWGMNFQRKQEQKKQENLDDHHWRQTELFSSLKKPEKNFVRYFS